MNCELEEQGYILGFMNGADFIFRVFVIYLKKNLYLSNCRFYYLGNLLNNRWWNSRSVQYSQTNLFGGGQEKDELVLSSSSACCNKMVKTRLEYLVRAHVEEDDMFKEEKLISSK